MYARVTFALLTMQVYSALQIGGYHLNNCEDYLFSHNIGDTKLLCGVMDGCTMGIDSYFISTLTGKLLRKVAKQFDHIAFYKKDAGPEDIEAYLTAIVKELFKELKLARNQLMLEERELLTTLIILLVDKQEDKGALLAIGDGLVGINGEVTEFEQNNKPDYIGYHLNEDFEEWYAKQKILISPVNDISIATDGITTFTKVKNITAVEESIDPILYLVNDLPVADKDDFLNRKLKKLEHVYGLKPTDDLAIIRVVKYNS